MICQSLNSRGAAVVRNGQEELEKNGRARILETSVLERNKCKENCIYLFLKVLWQVYDRIIVTIVVPLQIIRCGIIVVPLVRVPQKLASFFLPLYWACVFYWIEMG
jgi:hypothetical protein